MVHSQRGPTKHADLQNSRTRKDLSCVQNIVNVFQESFINLFSNSDFVYLPNASEYGKSAMLKFCRDRLEEGAKPEDFFSLGKNCKCIR